MLRFVLVLAIPVAAYLWWSPHGRAALQRLLPGLAIGLGLAYLASPIDLVPDASLVGFLDDLIVLAATIAWARQQRRSAPQADEEEASAATDPYQLLGLPRGASQEEVTRAYREKIKLYHPDRVNGLGAELQRVAHQKTIEIQRAYDALRGAKPARG